MVVLAGCQHIQEQFCDFSGCFLFSFGLIFHVAPANFEH